MVFLTRFTRTLAWMILLATGQLFAQAPGGTLYDNFGTGGVGSITLAGQKLKAHAVETMADGGVIIAGSLVDEAGTQHMVVTKMASGGRLETHFGNNGFFTYRHWVSDKTRPFTARASAMDGSGKIVIAGDDGDSFYVLRMNPWGTQDLTFGATRFPFIPEAMVTDVLVLADGRILVSGNSRSSLSSGWEAEIRCARPSGGADSFFDGSENFSYEEQGSTTVTSLRQQADGGILYAGSHSAGRYAYIGRLTPTGDEDDSFIAYRGRLSFSTPGSSSSSLNQGVRAMVLDAQQNILVAVTRPTPGDEMALMRFTSTGAPDTSFSTDGIHTFSLGGPSWVPRHLLIQSDGRIVLAAHQPDEPNTSQIRLRRYEWNGELDLSFGQMGEATFSTGSGGNLLGGLRTYMGTQLMLATTRRDTLSSDSLAAMRINRGPAAPLPDYEITASPQDQTVDAGQQITFQVQTTSPPTVPLVYSWFFNNTLLGRTNVPSFTLTAQHSHEGPCRVEITGQMLPQQITETSPTFHLLVRKPPILSAPPAAQSFVFINQNERYSFQYEGRLPATYKIYADGKLEGTQEITSGSDLHVPIFSRTAKARIYHLVVTNADGESRSDDFRVDFIPEPYVHPHPEVLARFGEWLYLTPEVSCNQEWFCHWKLKGKRLPGYDDLDAYYLEPTSLASAGTYAFTARTLSSSFTREIRVGIVDTRARQHMIAAGRKFKLTLPTSGVGLTYSWTHHGQPLQPRPGLSGLDGPTLTFHQPSAADEGAYTCTVKLGSTELTSEEQTLRLVTTVPTLETFTLDSASVGLFYGVYVQQAEGADRLNIKGLPPGLTYDPIEQLLSGIPTKSGRFPLTVTAVNPLGASLPVNVFLEILPIPTHGRFYATLYNNTHSAVVDVTLTQDGTYTGKITASNHEGRTASASFKGLMANDPNEGSDPKEYWGRSTLSFGGRLLDIGPTSLSLRIKYGQLYTGYDIPLPPAEDGPRSESFGGDMYRCPFSSKTPLDASYLGTFNLGFTAAEGRSRPGGSSYARATVSAAGLVTQVGVLADGTAFTSSAPLNQQFNVHGLRHLYGNRGVVQYSYTLTPGSQGPDYLNASISGSYYWLKNTPSYAGQKNYPIAINTTVILNACGKYLRPNHASGETGPLMMNLSPGPQNLFLKCNERTFSGELLSDHSVTFAPELEVNPLGFKKLKFNPTTGLFTGSASLRIEEKVYDEKKGLLIDRVRYQPYTFQGIVLRPPDSVTSFALGFGLLPESFLRPDTALFIRLNRSIPLELRGAF